MSPTPATSPADSRLTREKSTLFCPACDHESPVDGDWEVRRTEAGEQLDCPACGETVTVRPRMEADCIHLLPVVACSLALARASTRLLAWPVTARSGSEEAVRPIDPRPLSATPSLRSPLWTPRPG